MVESSDIIIVVAVVRDGRGGGAAGVITRGRDGGIVVMSLGLEEKGHCGRSSAEERNGRKASDGPIQGVAARRRRSRNWAGRCREQKNDR